jgi:hypothetical protein
MSKRPWRVAPIWRERFFLVLAGIAVGLMLRSVFPPDEPTPYNPREIRLPLNESLSAEKHLK